jgi:hypothetical protein
VQSLKLQLRSKVEEANIRARLPAMCEASEFDVVVRGNCTVYRPDGEPLFILIKEAFTEAEADAAYPALHSLRSMTSDNRASYAGAASSKGASNSTRAMDESGKRKFVRSAIVGYFDRQGGRHPYCRATNFTGQQAEAWQTIVPIAEKTSELFKQRLPAHHHRQMAAMAKVHSAYRISDTAFTTLTVNNNTRAGIHQDAGDFRDGFGCMAVFRKGHFTGAELGFPQYRVSADIGDRDLILFNPHEYHANTPYVGNEDEYERISVVFYMRARMQQCESPENEMKNARKVRGAIV